MLKILTPITLLLQKISKDKEPNVKCQKPTPMLPQMSKADPNALKIIKYMFIIFVFGGIIVCLAIGFDNLRMYSLRKKSLKLNVGDEKSQVYKILGSPVASFGAGKEFLGTRLLPQRWVYGKRLENFYNMFSTEFPWIIPFRFRYFDAYTDDIVIEFSDDERIMQVIRELESRPDKTRASLRGRLLTFDI